MPELPEIETIRRGLESQLVGRTITKIRVRETRFRHPLNAAKLRRWILHQTFAAFERRAKYLLCLMSNDACLVVHLGMSGRLLWCRRETFLEKHDHVRFFLEKQDELRFRDPRRFGMIDAIAPGKIHQYRLFQDLGLEPISESLTPEYLFDITRSLTRPIKNFLMDSTRIVGIGNIYANEALFRAGIHPENSVSKIRQRDWQRLVAAIKETLELAIASGGTTLNDFYNSSGEMGYFQTQLKVYGRGGKNCERCDASIQKIVQVGRSTFFCPNCQRKRK